MELKNIKFKTLFTSWEGDRQFRTTNTSILFRLHTIYVAGTIDMIWGQGTETTLDELSWLCDNINILDKTKWVLLDPEWEGGSSEVSRGENISTSAKLVGGRLFTKYIPFRYGVGVVELPDWLELPLGEWHRISAVENYLKKETQNFG